MGLNWMVYPTYYATRVVSKARAPEESIAGALAAISDASISKRYCIEVYPGIYSEDITMIPYVDIIGVDPEACIIAGSEDTTPVTAASNAKLEGVTVRVNSNATGTVAVAIGDEDGFILENMNIETDNGSAADVAVDMAPASDGNVIYMRRVRVQPDSAGNLFQDGVQCSATNNATLNIENCSVNVGRNHVDLTMNSGGDILTVNSYDNDLIGLGVGAVHWSLTETAGTLSVISNEDMYASISNTGANFYDITGAREYTCLATVLVGEWVYISAADTVAEAKSDSLTTMPCSGVVVYKASAAAISCLVKQAGYYYEEGAGWTATAEYWVSDAVAGTITAIMPGIWPQRVGIAKASDVMKILLGDNLGYGNTNVYLNAAGTITVGEWVYITATNDTVAEAKADVAATMPAIGVVCEIIDTTHCRVRVVGKFSEGTKGYTAGNDVFVSAATAGAITTTAPVGGIVQKVAKVKSDNATTIVYELA